MAKYRFEMPLEYLTLIIGKISGYTSDVTAPEGTVGRFHGTVAEILKNSGITVFPHSYQ